MTSTFALPTVPKLKRRSPRQWEIPLPARGEQKVTFDRSTSWKDGVEELQRLGFLLVHSAQGLRHYTVTNTHLSHDSRHLTEFGIWWHPAGLLAVGDSYQRGGYGHSNGEWDPHETVFGALRVAAEVDMGSGPEFAHLGGANISGTGGSRSLPNGSDRKIISWDAINSGLHGFLRNCQQLGRFVPVEEWVEQHAPSISADMLQPIMSSEEWAGKSQDELKAVLALQEETAQQELLDALPAPIRHAFDKTMREKVTSPRKVNGVQDWVVVEHAHREVGEALFLAGLRWPRPEQKALIQHWIEVAQGLHGENPAHWRWSENGPAGLTLATVLLFSNQDADAQRRLLTLIDAAPPAHVRQWLQEPDAAQHTLGLRLVWRLFKENINMRPSVEDLCAVADALIDKVGVAAWSMATPGRTVLGLFLQTHELGSVGTSDPLPKQHSRAVELLQHLQERGVQWEWDGAMRWRTYPNVCRDADPPAFAAASGLDSWQAAMASRHTQASKFLGQWAKAQALQERLQKTWPTPALTSSRPRM